MDQSTPKLLMDLHDSRITLNMVIKQEWRLIDILKVANVTAKGKDPISATLVVLVGERVLLGWNMGCFYRQTYHWEALWLEGYQVQHQNCDLREDDIQKWSYGMGSNEQAYEVENKDPPLDYWSDIQAYRRTVRHVLVFVKGRWTMGELAGRSSSGYKIYVWPFSGDLLHQRTQLPMNLRNHYTILLNRCIIIAWWSYNEYQWSIAKSLRNHSVIHV
jgi:hypothetical protein